MSDFAADLLIGEPVRCLFTHECSEDSHKLAVQIGQGFAVNGIKLLVDDFRPGDRIATRIETFDCEALVFLLSQASWSSHWCQEELRFADSVRIPVIAVRIEGDLPLELRERLVISLPPANTTDWEEILHFLAKAVESRGLLYRTISTLTRNLKPYDVRGIAQDLQDRFEPTILAEAVKDLLSVYFRSDDPNVRHWIAVALHKAGTREAVSALQDCFAREDHPYPRYAIQRAFDELNLSAVGPNQEDK